MIYVLVGVVQNDHCGGSRALSDLDAGISTHYNAIGYMKPVRVTANGLTVFFVTKKINLHTFPLFIQSFEEILHTTIKSLHS